ncbi:conserved hypothetical protein, membrane or secreted [Candidatus Magnetomorum sp. HK-1]|nr:conserved hypothetical protein, membrane or secreted [Candidatus Magnetomorum sp. HK-1]
MKKTKILMVALFLCVLNFGCATSFMSKTDHIYPAKNSDDVEIFFTQIPEKAYEEIGFIRVDKYPPLSPIAYTNNKIKEFMKTSAAQNGGDAVINITENIGQFSGTVIVYK